MDCRSIATKFRALSGDPRVMELPIDCREQFMKACQAAGEMYEKENFTFFTEMESCKPAIILDDFLYACLLPPKVETLIVSLMDDAWSIHGYGEEYWVHPSF